MQARSIRFVNTRTHNCAAAAQTFGINLSLFFAKTSLLRQRADDATSRTTSGRARQSCYQPSRRNDWTNARDCHDTQSSQKASGAARQRTDAAASGCAFSTIIFAVEITIR